MPDEPTPTDPAAEPETPAQGETDWVKEARKWEQRAKENQARLKEAEPKLAEYNRLVDASKSEAQRAAEAQAELSQRVAKAERDATKFRIALANGLTADDLQFIGGDDEASIVASAEAFKARVEQVKQSDGAPRAPRVDPSQGSSASGGASGNPREAFAAILRGT